MTANNPNGRKIPPVAWLGIVVFTAAQLVTWGSMQNAVSSMEGSLKSLKDEVIRISVKIDTRIVIQERKFEDRIVRLEDWVWELKAEVDGTRPRSFASQPFPDDGLPR